MIEKNCPECGDPYTEIASYDPGDSAIPSVRKSVENSSLPVCSHDRYDGGYAVIAHYPINNIIIKSGGENDD